jgi:hypothetical protein
MENTVINTENKLIIMKRTTNKITTAFGGCLVKIIIASVIGALIGLLKGGLLNGLIELFR